jgi:hypothetical protein
MRLPPIFISSELSTTIEEMNPKYSNLSAEELLHSDNPDELPDDLHYVTTIGILPYIEKSELHELIDEYWSELESRINQRTKHADKIIGEKLLGKVQPEKTKSKAERDEMILKLAEQGVSVKDTIAQLVIKGLATEKTLKPGNVRRIRSNLRKNKK